MACVHAVAQEFQDAVTSTIKDPEITLNSIIGFEDVKKSLKSALHFKMNSVLLFGPDEKEHYPLAGALANKWKATLFRVSGSNLEEMEWWRSAEYVRTLLEVAHEKSPSIIFVDEVEKLDEEAKTEFINQAKEDNKIIVIGSTSHPTRLGTSFQNWFQMKVFVPFPDFEVRKTLIKSELRFSWYVLSNEELDLMSSMTKGYKRRDISKIIQQLFKVQQHLIKSATHFIKLDGRLIGSSEMIVKDMFVPCLPKQPGAFKAKYTDFHPDTMFEPPIILSHFFYVIDRFPKPSRKSVKECGAFNNKYGTELFKVFIKASPKKKGFLSCMICL